MEKKDNSEPVEELNELEEIEELYEPASDTSPEHVNHTISGERIRGIQKTYGSSSIPFVLADGKLKIIWGNQSYEQLISRGQNYIGDYFTRFFFSERNEAAINEMYRHLSLGEKGYSWKGRLETSDKNYLTVLVNALISPIFSFEPDDEKPAAYGIVLDNITRENRELLRGTFSSLLEASILKDNDTGHHVQRVNEYCKILSEKIMGSSAFPEVDLEFIENISFLAAMHDVGKIGIPDDILNKKGPLDDREWTIMKEHTINGAYILKAYPNSMAKDIALFHHEKWEGSGYPYNIQGDLIPLSARIVAVADVYDALRMKRSYKEGFTHEKACEIIQQNSGTHFDPRLIDHFFQMDGKFNEIFTTLADTEN